MRRGKFEILVLGAGRSGTSLLAGLLDAHSKLTVRQEFAAAPFLMGLDRSQPMASDEAARAFREACAQEAGRQANIWGNKITTEQLDLLINGEDPRSYFEMLSGFLFKDLHIIYIIRDPRTCVWSKMQRSGCDFETGRARYRRSIYWHRLLQERDGVQITEMRFEKLILDPEKELRFLCHHLDIAFEQKMLSGTSNIKMSEKYRRSHFDESKLTMDSQHLRISEGLEKECVTYGY